MTQQGVRTIIALDQRRRRVLAEVVRQYIKGGHPVGSQQVASALRVRVSSATVRNDMAALEEAGLISHPHTSAGRTPTDGGYRFYVDHLMPRRSVPGSQRVRVEERYREPRDAVDEVLRETSDLIAELAGYTAVVVGPEVQPRLKHLHASPVNSHHILVVWVTSDGRIEHRLIETPKPVSARQLERISEVLTNRLSSVEVSAIPRVDVNELMGQLPRGLNVPPDVLRHIRDSIEIQERESVFVDGALYILRQPEFADVERARQVMEALSQAPLVRRLLRPSIEGDRLTVTIGSEALVPQMRECSVVSYSFRLGPARGAVGVVGPTRMAYSHTVPIVTLIAERLSRSLARLQSA